MKSEGDLAARSRKRLSFSSPLLVWEARVIGLASRNWDGAYDSEGGHFGVMSLNQVRHAGEFQRYRFVQISPRSSGGNDFKQRDWGREK